MASAISDGPRRKSTRFSGAADAVVARRRGATVWAKSAETPASDSRACNQRWTNGTRRRDDRRQTLLGRRPPHHRRAIVAHVAHHQRALVADDGDRLVSRRGQTAGDARHDAAIEFDDSRP